MSRIRREAGPLPRRRCWNWRCLTRHSIIRIESARGEDRMAPQDLAPFVRRRPFVPFRIMLTEGSTYDIRHPELCMVGRREAHIGLDASEGPDHFFERYVI